jgi:hypothetical protein
VPYFSTTGTDTGGFTSLSNYAADNVRFQELPKGVTSALILQFTFGIVLSVQLRKSDLRLLCQIKESLILGCCEPISLAFDQALELLSHFGRDCVLIVIRSQSPRVVLTVHRFYQAFGVVQRDMYCPSGVSVGGSTKVVCDVIQESISPWLR